MKTRWVALITICLMVMSAPVYTSQTDNKDLYSQSLKRVNLLSSSPYVRIHTIGKSTQGRTIPALIITNYNTGMSEKTRVFICAGQHGNETNPVKSVLSLSARLATGRDSSILSKCVIIIVPFVNPDGLSQKQRLNAQFIDINRDWRNLTTPETQCINKLIENWKPHVLLDLHEWLTSSSIARNSIESSRNIPNARAVGTMSLARDACHNSHLKLIWRTSGTNPNLFHRKYASSGYAAYLLETAPGWTYEKKHSAYINAVMTVIDQVSQRTDMEQVSPASGYFQMASVARYISQPNIEKKLVPDTFIWGFVIAVGSCLVLVMLMPTPRAKNEKWSRKFKKCSIDEQIPTEWHHKSHLVPITARSWVHRRTRSRYIAPTT